MRARLATWVIAYARGPRAQRMWRELAGRAGTPANRRRAGELARRARRRLAR